MHIELIDLLRCPKDHEETWLVAALNAIEDRIVIKAKLGCPVCGSSYFISRGIADLRTNQADITAEPADANSNVAVRIAALLNLTRPGSLAILQGKYASDASDISEMTNARVIALNSSARVDDSELVASVLSEQRIPFATASVDGLALDDIELLPDAARVLRPGGRLIVNATSSLPPGITEIARDDQNIVGESAGEVLQLRR
jgi:uncharacterized protein YbaR (Trm112 family)